jgi:hypothetical protein
MIFLASGFIAIAATKTPLIIGSTANIRPRILRYDVSTTGTPTSDQSVEYQVRRATALGTTTAYTLLSSDPSDTAGSPVVTAGVNATIEPTYAAGSWLVDRGQNPRATYQWAAYSADEEIILPATAAAGVGWQITGAGGGAGNLLVNCSVRQ